MPCSCVSIAAATAPQFVWPSTTKSGVCKWRPAYCRLPAISGDRTFPATRMMNNSPRRGVEDQLRRHPRIAATQDRGVGMLALGEIGEDLLLHRGESRGPGDESFVARFRRSNASSAESVVFSDQPSRTAALPRLRTTGWSVMMTVVPGVSVS